ncbi:MAG: twin-arginine translocation pathway signal protein [Methylobacter sp.]|nr:MAG: twin-arginine translocation pathway signal protein [Methylobacter sp.]PPD32330.1 MAG: twin-arginine translocation pathway signal protein [Methylomonas sp.]
MNHSAPAQTNPKPETEDGMLILNVSRRDFLKQLTLTGLVLATGFAVEQPEAKTAAKAKPVKYGADAMPHGWVDNALVFVAIAEDGTVTVYCHRSEMGQGVRTSLPMVVADELEADWEKVKVIQAPGDEIRFGNQDTDGSRSLRHFFMPMRRVGAAARQMLEQAAADRWQVPVGEVKAESHYVMHSASGRKLAYGELAAAAAALPVPARETLKLKNPEQFRYIGKGKTGLYDGRDLVTGQGRFGIDTRLDGLLYAVVARPPAFGDTLAGVDDSEALKVPGVIKTVTLKSSPPPAGFNPLGGVAVIATNTWAAIQGRKALKINWRKGPNGHYDSADYHLQLSKAAQKPGQVVRNDGNTDAALKAADKRVEAEYYIPHLAQAPMEPPAATALIDNGHCRVWTCTQAPQATRELVAKWLKLPEANVEVNVTLLGGGFGRKSKPDYVVEAALLSEAMAGKPVKVTWTREDDLQHAYYHTVSVEHLKAGLDKQGKTLAWLHRTVAPSLTATFGPDKKHQAPLELSMGAINVPFAIANVRIENPEAKAHTRIGWFRSVSNIPHAFAVQSFVAELAAAAGRDHKDYLLELIGPARKIDPTTLGDAWNHSESPALYPVDTGRLRQVITAATQAAGWGKTLPAGHGLGLAAHYSFLTYVAVVIEAAIDKDGKLGIPRVDIAVDCGARINPERIRSQMEGACIMGLTLAKHGEISFKNGVAEQDNFHTYALLRMDEAPAEINVHFVDSSGFDQPLGGIGEPAVPPMAPALCNAIFAATGKRLRTLPIKDQLLPA